MAWEEGFDLVTDRVERLDFGSKIHGTWFFGRPALIQCGDADWVPRSNQTVLFLVV